MIKDHIKEEVLKPFRHEDIHGAIYELKTFWDEVNQYGIGPKYEEMSLKLTRFRSMLANHFVEEQLYLQSLIKLGARINQAQYGQILDEHTVFLERLADDIERLELGTHRFRNWALVMEDFDDIIDRITEHEAAEQEMIANAVDLQDQQIHQQ